jgi:hypothetical protein
MTRLALVLIAALMACACGRIERPRHGGDQEQALAKAAFAHDATAVDALLALHADPAAMVEINGRDQSAWYVALDQLRPGRPETMAVIASMLKAGADPNVTWGTAADVTRLPRSRWDQFWSGGRQAGSGAMNPLAVVMFHATPEAVRALVDAKIDPRLGENALVDAIESGEDEIARILVDAGVDVNSHPGANTPLLAAIEARNIPLMTFLEEHGAREKP